MNFFNYKSDFDLILIVADAKDKTVNMNNYDWTAKFSTTRGSHTFLAEHRGKATTNAYIEYGAPHVIFDSHSLGLGQLMLELTVFVKDADFPDGTRRVVTPVQLPVELVPNQGNTATSAKISITVPFTQSTDMTANKDDLVEKPTDKPSYDEQYAEKDPTINWEEVE